MSDNLVEAEAAYWEEKERKEVLWGRRTGKSHTSLHAMGVVTKDTCPICKDINDED